MALKIEVKSKKKDNTQCHKSEITALNTKKESLENRSQKNEMI